MDDAAGFRGFRPEAIDLLLELARIDVRDRARSRSIATSGG